MDAIFETSTQSQHSGMTAGRIQGFGGASSGREEPAQQPLPYKGIFSDRAGDARPSTSDRGFGIGAPGSASATSYRGTAGVAMGGIGNPEFADARKSMSQYTVSYVLTCAFCCVASPGGSL